MKHFIYFIFNLFIIIIIIYLFLFLLFQCFILLCFSFLHVTPIWDPTKESLMCDSQVWDPTKESLKGSLKESITV